MTFRKQVSLILRHLAGLKDLTPELLNERIDSVVRLTEDAALERATQMTETLYREGDDRLRVAKEIASKIRALKGVGN